MIILDIIAAIITLVALCYIPKKYSMWLVYALGCILFLIVRIYAKQYGSVVLEIVAINIAIRHYIHLKGKK